MKGNIHKFITAISLVAMIATTCFAAMPVQAASQMTADLIIDGRHMATDIGDVTVWNDEDGFHVKYEIDSENGWSLSEVHTYVSTDEPTKSSPGKFDFVDDTVTGKVYTWVIPLNEIGPDGASIEDSVYVAAHAAVTSIDGNSESAWAQAGNDLDTPIPPGKNWATYFVYKLGEYLIP